MEEVQRYDCLNNNQRKEFNEKNKKINSWETIAKMLNSTPHEDETKFKNIGTAYGRYGKQIQSAGSGSGIQE